MTGSPDSRQSVDDIVGANTSTFAPVHPVLSQGQARFPKECLTEQDVTDGMLGDVPLLSLHVIARQGLLGIDSVAKVVRGSRSPEPCAVGCEVHVSKAFD